MKPSRLSFVATALSRAVARQPTANFRKLSFVRPIATTVARAVSANGPTIREFASKPVGPAASGAPVQRNDLEGPFIVEVTKENFDMEVNKSVRPVILDVYADW